MAPWSLSLLHKTMIQNCYSLFKMFFKNNSFAHDIQSFQSFENTIINHPDRLTPHISQSLTCSYPSSQLVGHYERNYIYREDSHNVYSRCIIPVFYCSSCRHYHALLPYTFMIPYFQYSLSFVISVLYDRLMNLLTVDEIICKYQISKNTLYRWLDAYYSYYRIFLTMKNRSNMNFFMSYLSQPLEFIDSMFSIAHTSLFQKNCTLFHQTQ